VAAARVVGECDQKLARCRAALEAGTDPDLVARSDRGGSSPARRSGVAVPLGYCDLADDERSTR
jgi:hypothetical protein